MNKLTQCDSDSIFYYFERSREKLTLLEKYGISLNEFIGSATSKVNLLFETMVHSHENILLN